MPDSITSDPSAERPVLSLPSDMPERAGTMPGRGGAGTSPTPTLADQAVQKLTGALEGRKNAAADLVEEFAQTVHRSGEQFQGRQQWIANAVERGAAELHMLAGSLRGQQVGDLAYQVQSLARRRPAVFIGGALAAGFALARLGKIAAADLSRDDLPTVPEVGHGQH